jgi:hypothetical protein
MLRRIRPRLGYANVVATLALVLAVGGSGAYAAQRIRAHQIAAHAITGSKINFNAVTGSKVKGGSLSGSDLRDGTVTTGDVRDGTLRATDFAANQLPQGPKGDPGASAADLHGTVAADGTLTNAAGATAVSTGAGASYTVTFDRSVSACAIVATIATSGDGDGGVVSGAAGSGAQQVTFRTRDFDGAAVAKPFSFALFC